MLFLYERFGETKMEKRCPLYEWNFIPLYKSSIEGY